MMKKENKKKSLKMRREAQFFVLPFLLFFRIKINITSNDFVLRLIDYLNVGGGNRYQGFRVYRYYKLAHIGIQIYQ